MYGFELPSGSSGHLQLSQVLPQDYALIVMNRRYRRCSGFAFSYRVLNEIARCNFYLSATLSRPTQSNENCSFSLSSAREILITRHRIIAFGTCINYVINIFIRSLREGYNFSNEVMQNVFSL